MARQLATSIENSFIKGRITEATGLNFPENAVTDESNCTFLATGAVQRRKGIDYEPSATQNNATRTGGVMQTFVWTNVGGQVALDFLVQQVESLLYFFEISPSGNLSANRKTFSVNLATQKVSGSPSASTEPCQFAVGSGRLYVAHPYCDPFFIEYSPSGDSITVTSITIKTRDMIGVEDSLTVDERPSTLSSTHKYNLYNQGWYTDAKIKSASVTNVVTAWNTARSTYPSNADVWYLYKDTTEEVDWTYVDKYQLNNTPAAKGHYILDEFNKDRATASGISGIVGETSSYMRPSTVAFFSGRLFYSGVNYGAYGNKVYFSPVIERDAQFGMCYQASDPTIEDSVGLVSSDGGFFLVPDAGTILKLVTLKSSLVIFATNGIWSLGGSTGSGFLTDDFTVTFLGVIGFSSSTSFVDVEGAPVWWGDGGIYSLTADNLGSLQITPLTDKSIRSFYNSLGPVTKQNAQGSYNPTTKLVHWVYSSVEPTSTLEDYEYDTVLFLNTQTGAFYTWYIGTNPAVKIHGVLSVKGSDAQEIYIDVVDNASALVVDNTGATISVADSTLSTTSKVTKFVVSTVSSGSTYHTSFAIEQDVRYLDWYSYDSAGVDYSSYFVSGYKVHADAQRRFQSNYLTVITKNVPGASCFVEISWDWSTSGTNTLTYSRQQVYNARTNRDYQHRRLKMRGSGLAAQLRYESVSGAPFTIVGWSSTESATSGV